MINPNDIRIYITLLKYRVGVGYFMRFGDDSEKICSMTTNTCNSLPRSNRWAVFDSLGKVLISNDDVKFSDSIFSKLKQENIECYNEISFGFAKYLFLTKRVHYATNILYDIRLCDDKELATGIDELLSRILMIQERYADAKNIFLEAAARLEGDRGDAYQCYLMNLLYASRAARKNGEYTTAKKLHEKVESMNNYEKTTRFIFEKEKCELEKLGKRSGSG